MKDKIYRSEREQRNHGWLILVVISSHIFEVSVTLEATSRWKYPCGAVERLDTTKSRTPLSLLKKRSLGSCGRGVRSGPIIVINAKPYRAVGVSARETRVE